MNTIKPLEVNENNFKCSNLKQPENSRFVKDLLEYQWNDFVTIQKHSLHGLSVQAERL